jgi:predicted PurR-regulated permease PerM
MGQVVERNPWGRALVILGVVAVGLYLAGELWRLALHFGDVIVLFFLSWLLAFALLPVVRLIEWRLRLPRVAAAAIVYLGLLLVLATCLVLVIPLLVEQVSQLAFQLPSLADKIPPLSHDVQDWLDRRGVPVDIQTAQVQAQFGQQTAQIGAIVVENTVLIASSVASGFFSFTIVLILSFYVVLDGDRFVTVVLEGLPDRYHDDALRFVYSIDRTFGGFLRGVGIQAGILGLGTGIIMAVGGLSYVLLASIFAAVVMVVPFIGPFLALVLPIIIAIFSNLPPSQILVLFIALAILQLLVLNVVAPKVMSQTVGLHPLLVFLALLVGIKEAGLAGAIFGVPVAAVINATVRILFNRWALIETTSPRQGPRSSSATRSGNSTDSTPVVRFERIGPHLGRAISRVFHAWTN